MSASGSVIVYHSGSPHAWIGFNVGNDDADRPFHEPSGPVANTEYACYLQYPFDVATSSTFLEDAQYLLGTYANYHERPANPLATSSTYNNVEHHDNYLYTPLEQLMSNDDPDEVVFPGHVPALPQVQVQVQVQVQAHAPAPAPPAVVAAPQPSGQTLLTCPIGCNATFSRPGEYRRHMKKHGPRAFPCTQPGCGMAFYRKDKRHDHLRQAHGT
ncbi:hypothetical protein CC86DRAFT_388576 [Ophiobolus disseminans]|uniref:C2H2-type domain-containing protein n=1 Tax=Ophiobolus disseminans TaxID=1469910 RepID=A0A6A6ZCW8_9PLEO|nr:hypothetical protein CC86DRAFT_388576 [Ophiobolus disseminans]